MQKQTGNAAMPYPFSRQTNESQDLCIINGQILDGTGSSAYPGSILIRDGIITDMGAFMPPEDTRVIDAAGMYVTPGFIDLHRHCDHAVFKEGFGVMESSQGITSTVSGLCGLTPYPAFLPHGNALHEFITFCAGTPADAAYDSYAGYITALQKIKIPIKVNQFIGSCAVRIAVKGFAASPFTPEELEAARSLVAEAMTQGALGLSLGLMYLPEYYSTKEDIIALAKEAARYGGILAVHIRNEGDNLPESVREAAEVAEAADMPLEISHFKSCGMNGRREKLMEAVAIIEAFRQRGVDIHADFYPYTFGSSVMQSLIPPEFIKESPAEFYAYMATREGAEAFAAAVSKPYDGWDNYLYSLGIDRIVIASTRRESNAGFIGKTLRELGGDHPLCHLSGLIADEQGQTGIFVHSMSPEDVDTIAALPWVMVASDALYADGVGNPGGAASGLTHPRARGTFTKILSGFVRDRNLLPLPAAIHKMTGMPTQKMGFKDRGLLRKGFAADICVFDLMRISEGNGEWGSTGLSYVLRDGIIIREEDII